MDEFTSSYLDFLISSTRLTEQQLRESDEAYYRRCMKRINWLKWLPVESAALRDGRLTIPSGDSNFYADQLDGIVEKIKRDIAEEIVRTMVFKQMMTIPLEERVAFKDGARERHPFLREVIDECFAVQIGDSYPDEWLAQIKANLEADTDMNGFGNEYVAIQDFERLLYSLSDEDSITFAKGLARVINDKEPESMKDYIKTIGELKKIAIMIHDIIPPVIEEPIVLTQEQSERLSALQSRRVEVLEHLRAFDMNDAVGMDIVEDFISSINRDSMDRSDDTIDSNFSRFFDEGFSELLKELTGKDLDQLKALPEYKNTFDRLATITLLTRQADAIREGRIETATADAPEKITELVVTMKKELTKELLATHIIPVLMRGNVEDRRSKLVDYSNRYGFLVSLVDNYLPAEVELTNEKLTQIISMINDDRIAFSEMKRRVDESWHNFVLDGNVVTDSERLFRTGEELDKILTEFSPDLKNEVYAQAEAIVALDEEIRSLTGDEQVAKQTQRDELKTVIDEKFEHIPGLSELFNYYIASIEVGKSYAADDARRATMDTPLGAPVDSSVVSAPTREQTINTRFLVDDITGEVISNDGSYVQRVTNLTYAVEGYSWRNEPDLVAQLEKTKRALIEQNMPGSIAELEAKLKAQKQAKDKCGAAKTKQQLKEVKAKRKVLEEKYGPNWEVDYRRELETRITAAQEQSFDRAYGVTQARAFRQANREALARGEVPTPLPAHEVTFDELRFVARNFEQILGDDGSVRGVVDKVTGQVVTSPRTIATLAFAKQWMTAYDSDSPDQVFTDDARIYYESFMRERKDLMRREGEVSVESMAGIVGDAKVGRLRDALFGTAEATSGTEAFYAMQTPQPTRVATDSRTV